MSNSEHNLLSWHVPLVLTSSMNSICVWSTLHPWPVMIRMSAGTLSPPLISTKSPTTNSLALIWFFWPSRITMACCVWRLGARLAKMKGDGHMKKSRVMEKESDTVIWTCGVFSLVMCAHLWHQILEACNDVGTLEFLVVTKATSYHDDSN